MEYKIVCGICLLFRKYCVCGVGFFGNDVNWIEYLLYVLKYYRWFLRKMVDCDGDEMFFVSEYEGFVLFWDCFRRWVICFCVVMFDLEFG